MFKLDLEKAEEPELKLPQFVGSLKKQEDSRKKKIYFCFIDYAKALTVWITTNCGKFIKIWEYKTTYCLLRNLDADQEATVKTGHGKTDCFQIGKGIRQGCILSPCLFNLYAECIMQNARVDESQAQLQQSRLLGEISTTSDMQMIPL